MALADSTFLTDLQNAFKTTKWSDPPSNGCAEKLASAIKSYIESGKVNTTVAITVTPPFGPPYSSTASGTNGSVSASASASLAAQFASLFLLTSWTTIPASISTYINTYFKNITISITTYQAPTIGTGSIFQVNSDSGVNNLTTKLTSAFQKTSWDDCASDIKDGVKTFITQSNIILTIDSGTVPANSWTNTSGTHGQGTIS